MTITDHQAGPCGRRKAYSYLRFSTPEQGSGNSFQRQASLASAYATRHGLDLDEQLTFHDLGKSGFRRQNVDTGRLGDFLEAVRSGTVPHGSVLLVEQLDRLSRLSPRRALRVLESIVDEGVSVVTLNDGREYTSASMDADPVDLMVSVLTFTRANEESATKSRRLKAAWEAKRAAIADGKPLTSRAPAWLQLSLDRSRFEVLEDRAAIVRRMFDMTLEGAGQNMIATTLNREKVSPWGRGRFWHRSYVAKILANPAVIGTFHPHLIEYDDASKRRVPLEPVEGFYPAVVSRETFFEVQALKQALSAPQRGRHAHSPITNVLAGLAACPKCGESMTRVAKGNRSKPSYVCTRAKIGAGCEYKSVRCDVVQEALLRLLPGVLRNLEGATGGDEGLDDAIEKATEAVDHLHDRIGVLLDNLSYEQSPALRKRLAEREADLREAQEALQKLVERREVVTGLTVAARAERALEALEKPEEERSIPAINEALRRLFRKVTIDGPGQRIELEWTHGGAHTMPLALGVFKPWPGEGFKWADLEVA
jgi:DNA invertase Pin-like site-specific DNA recombinase